MKIHEYNEMMSYLTRPSKKEFKRNKDFANTTVKESSKRNR